MTTRNYQTANTEAEAADRRSIRRHLITGATLVAALVVGVGGWAVSARLSAAVVAQGTLVVDGNVKKVQHPTGGVVGEVLVRDGDRVAAGDVLVRLDDTVSGTDLAMIAKEYDTLAIRGARLLAERDGLTEFTVPPGLAARSADPEVAALVVAERRLLDAALAARNGQRSQYAERITQLEREVAGNITQEAAYSDELIFAERQLAAIRDLWERQLATLDRLTTLEREVVRLQSARSQVGDANIRLAAQIEEIRLQIAQIDHDGVVKVGEELRAVEARLAQLAELRVAAAQAMTLAEIRAPQSGIVHQSIVHTVGGVIIPDGQPLMLIVPEDENLTVEARVRPQDVDQLAPGAAARIRLSSFNQRTTPEIGGTIERIAADISQDPMTGQSYYTLRIAVPEAELASLPDLRLIPGMPAEVFVETGSRSVLSYVLKPLGDQLARAFREH